MDRPVLLRDISIGGFSVLATFCLTLGVTYQFRFAFPQSVIVKARLTHLVAIRSAATSGYLLGFEFVDVPQHEAAIAALITHTVGNSAAG